MSEENHGGFGQSVLLRVCGRIIFFDVPRLFRLQHRRFAALHDMLSCKAATLPAAPPPGRPVANDWRVGKIGAEVFILFGRPLRLSWIARLHH
jgi:hypothetical protein